MTRKKERKVPSGEDFGKDYFSGKTSNYLGGYSKIADNEEFWKRVLEIIGKYKLSGNFLDIGCAYGYLIKNVTPYFQEVHGFDISDFATGKAREIVPQAKLSLGDLNKDKLPYQDGFFDFITILETIASTESVEETLRKIAPKLKEDGILMVATPVSGAKETGPGKLFSEIWERIDKDKTRISVPTEKELLKMVDRAGLKTVEINHVFVTPYGPLNNLVKGSIELILKRKS